MGSKDRHPSIPMLKLLTVLAVAHAAALMPAARPLKLSSKHARATPLQMSDVKGPKDWAFIKGKDAAGKENTYMYLGAKKGAAPEVNKLAAAIGQEENPFAFVLEPYFILLFAPFAIVMAYEFNHILKFGRF